MVGAASLSGGAEGLENFREARSSKKKTKEGGKKEGNRSFKKSPHTAPGTANRRGHKTEV